MPDHLPSKNLVPISEAAELLGVSIDTIRRWDKEGLLHSSRASDNTRYFSLKELEKVKFSKPLSISEAVQQLGISATTLRRLEKKGLIKPERNGNGERLYAREEIEKFLNSEYFLRQREIEEKVLEPFLEPEPAGGEIVPETTRQQTSHRILGFLQHETAEEVSKLKQFKKAFYISGLLLTTVFILLIAIITLLFLLFPEETAKFFGYSTKTPPVIASQQNEEGAVVLGVSYPGSPKIKGSVLGQTLKPFSTVSLNLVRQINKETYEKIVPDKPIKDVNDVLTIDQQGNITPIYNFTVPDTSYLQIPDRGLITNLNADYIRGRVPGDKEGDLVVFGEGGGIDGLVVVGGNLADNSVTSAKIKDGTIGDAKLVQITSSNKVAGSAVQIATGGGLTNNSGLSLSTSCSSTQILAWNGSAWACGAATEADTLATVTGRGATTATALTLSSASPLTFSDSSPVLKLATVGTNGALTIRDAEVSPNTLLTLTDTGTSGTLTVNTLAASNIGAFTLTGSVLGSAGTGITFGTGNNGSGASGGLTLSSGTGSTNTGALTIISGAAAGGNSGNVSLDTGTASGTVGSILLGQTNALTITIGKSGLTTGLSLTDDSWSISAVGAATLASAIVSGNVGIGTTAPSAALDVRGEIIAPKISKVIIVDGITYPQTATGINNALAALGATGGEVYLPPGTYTIDTDVLISKNNVILRGAGEETVLKLTASTQANAIKVSSASNVTIRDLQIDGNKANVNTTGAIYGTIQGIMIDASSNVTVENLKIHDCYFASIMITNASTDVWVVNNLIWNGYFGGIASLSDSKRLHITGNTVHNCDMGGIIPIDSDYLDIRGNILYNNGPASTSEGSGISIQGCRYSSVIGNIAYGNGEKGILIDFTTETTDSAGYRRSADILVEGNEVYNQTATSLIGIGVLRSDNITIRGNLVHNNYFGIGVGETTKITVVGNTVSDNDHIGIRADDASASDLVIAENTVRNNVEHGIVSYVANTVISSNKVIGNGWDGIALGSGNGQLIQGNTVNDNGWMGVRLTSGVANAEIKDNLFSNTVSAQDYAVYEETGAGPTTCQNNRVQGMATGDYLLTHASSIWTNFNTLVITGTSDLRGAISNSTGNLFLNDDVGISGNLGIGNTVPLNRLDISGSTAIGTLPTSVLPQSNMLYVSGNVGIGTTSPSSKLFIASAENQATLNAGAAAHLVINSYAVSGVGPDMVFGTTNTGGPYGWIQMRNPITNGSAYNFALNPLGGNVGIGTTNPAVALEIGGTGNLRIGGLSALSGVYTDANKTLTSTPPTSGTLGYWTRSGTTLWPATNTDNVTTLGNVGIGTTTPLNKLDVSGSAAIGALPTSVLPQSNMLYVSGNVGIGTTNPTAPLDVRGEIIAPKISKVIIVDGITYAQTAAGINSALAALGATGGEVYLPPGTYTIDTDVLISKNNVILRGAGEETVLKLANGTQANAIKVSGATNVRISNLQIDGNKANVDTGGATYFSVSGIYITGSDNVRVENCSIHDCYNSSIQAVTSTDIWWVNNHAWNGNLAALTTWWEVDRVHILGNTTHDTTYGGIVCINSDNLEILGNISYDNGPSPSNEGGGIDLQGCVNVTIANNIVWGNAIFGIHTGLTSEGGVRRGAHILIENNNVYNHTNTLEPGIRIWGSDEAIIRGNSIHDNAVGIAVQDADKIEIANNNIVDNTAIGARLLVTATNVTVSDNLIRGNNLGITSYVPDGVITNNTIIESGQDGISMADEGDGNLIRGNNIGDNSWSGIRLASGVANTEIKDNLFYNTSTGTQDYAVVENSGAGPTTCQNNRVQGMTVGEYSLTHASSIWTNFNTLVITGTSDLRGAISNSTGNLYLNDDVGISGNLGVGITAPLNRLDISGSVAIGSLPTSALPQSNMLYVSGNVGVGTTNPISSLTVSKEIAHTYPTPGTTTGTIHLRPNVGTDTNSMSITFGGTYGGGTTYANVAEAGIYAQTSGNWGSKLYFGTTDIYATGSQVRMMIDQKGNVGIGTTAPLNTLQVYGTIKAGGNYGNQQTGIVGLGDDTSSGTYVGIFRGTSAGASGGGNVLLAGGFDGFGITTGNNVLGSQGTPRLFIDTGGNVGIGTTGPSEKLHIQANADTKLKVESTLTGGGGQTALMLANSVGTVAYEWLMQGMADDGRFRIYDNAGTSTGERLTITTDGNVGIGTPAPNQKLEVITGTGINTQLRLGKTGYTTEYYDIGRVDATGFLSIQGAQTGNNSILLAPTSGNVGIGTPAPGAKLDITVNGAGSAVEALRLTNSDYGYTLNSGAGMNFYYAGIDKQLANISAAIETGGNGNWGYLSLGTRTDDTLGVQEKIRITSGGNVGIGTTAPAALLDIFKASASITGGPTIRLTRDYLGNDYGSAIFDGWDGTQDVLMFGVSVNSDPVSNEKMRITSAGNVGIGTTNPTALLSVGSTSQFQVNSSGNVTFATTLTPTAGFTLGSASYTGALTTSDWTIGTTGNLAGIGTIAMDGSLTMSGARPFIYSNRTDAAGWGGGLIWQQGGVNDAELFYDSSAHDLLFWSDEAGAGGSKFQLRRTGNMQIGDSSIDDNVKLKLSTNPTTTSGNKWAEYIENIANPTGASSGRYWGLQFVTGVQSANAQNFTDGLAFVGVEGKFQHNGTGTVAGGFAFLGLIDNTSTGTITNAYTQLFLTPGNSGGGHLTNSDIIHMDGNAAFTANNQRRVGLWVNGMPDPGVYTGTTVAGIQLAGTSGTARDGLLFGTDTNLYRVAANQLGTDDGFYVAGNVGIGTTSPGAKLEVVGTSWLRGAAGTTGLFVDAGGNVGIGTTAPTALLHLGIGSTAVVGQKIVLASGATANAFEVNSSTGVGGDKFVIQANGNVGIGTTAPLTTLDVRGTIENGLIGWWPMDEGTGTTTADRSINTHTGSFVGAPAWITGKFNNALDFDGTDDYLNVGNLGINAPATVEMWLKPDNTTSDRRIFQQLSGGTSQGGGIGLSIYDAYDIYLWDGANWLQLVNNTADWVGEWHHLTVVYKSNGQAVGYFDGVEKSTVTCNFDFNGISAGIAAKFLNAYGGNFDGSIDEVRVYNRALSAREINEQYRQQAPSMAQGGTINGKLLMMGGNVGIGTTDPGQKLEVNGMVKIDDLTLGGGGTTYVYSNAGVLTTTSASSIRYKENVKDYGNVLEAVSKLRPVSFNWKQNTTTPGLADFGFIAEEVYPILPEMVQFAADGTTIEGFRYDKLPILLTKAIQEQQNQIANLVLSDTGDLNITLDSGKGTYQVTDTGGNVITQAAALGEAIIAKIKAGLIQTKELLAEKKIVSPLVETGVISPLPDSSDVIIKLGSKAATSSGFGQLLVQNNQGETVAGIDTGGNATFSGQLNADELITKRLYADEIVTKYGKFGDLLVNQIAAVELVMQERSSQAIDQTISEDLQGLQSTLQNAQENSGLTSVSHLTVPSLVNNSISEKQKEILAFLKQLKEERENYASEVFTDRVAASHEVITPQIITDLILAKKIKADSIEGLEILTDKISSLAQSQKSLADKIASDSASLRSAEFAVATESAQIVGNEASASAQLAENLKIGGDSLKVLSDLVVDKSVKVALDMSVIGKLKATGGLTIEGPAEFKGNAIFNAIVEFIGDAIFRGNISFLGRPIFNKDTGGFAVIEKDADFVEVTFEKEYETMPIVSANLTFEEFKKEDGTADDQSIRRAKLFEQGYTSMIVNRTKKGFTIVLNKKATEEMTFSWVALAVKDAKMSFGKKPVPTEIPQPSPTASAGTAISTSSPTPQPTLVPSITPSPEATGAVQLQN